MLPRSLSYKRNRGLGNSSPHTWLHPLGWALLALAVVILLGLAVLTLRCGGLGWVRP